MPMQKLVGGPRKKIAAPVQAPPTWPVTVHVDYIDGEEPVVFSGYEATIEGPFLKIATSSTEQLFVRLETVRTLRVIGAAVQRIVEETLPFVPSGPREHVVDKTKIPRARAIAAKTVDGQPVPASVIVNPDGTTEIVEASLS